MDIGSWVERYGRAWREKDDEAVAVLFAEGALYVSHPLPPPHRGREGIRAYWRRATADQEGLDLRFGEPVVSAVLAYRGGLCGFSERALAAFFHELTVAAEVSQERQVPIP
jgi:ketosteroid isomerase-like protein